MPTYLPGYSSQPRGARWRILLILAVAGLASIPLAVARSTKHSHHRRLTLGNLGTLTGRFRDYDFARWYENSSAPLDQHANGLAGLFNFRSRRFGGHWRGHASFYVATDLFGVNNSQMDYRALDTTLFGTHTLQSLGQAYLTYQQADFQIGGGAFPLNTPWMGSSDSRLIPATYEGLFGRWSPAPGWTLEAIREFRWKSRTSSRFSATNLYNSAGVADIYGGTPDPAVGNSRNPGTLALGSAWVQKTVRANLWYYDFYHFAQMAYGSGSLHLPLQGTSFLVVGIQGLREWSQHSTSLGIPVSSSVYGAEIGLGFASSRLILSYDRIPQAVNDFRNGAVVSPYTSGYATDPLYTTSMTAGLVEKGPGQALKLAWTQFLEHSFRIILSEAGYWTTPSYPDTHETDVDLTWFAGGLLRGLSVRNRLGIVTGINGQYGTPDLGTFLYERLMFQYRF
jgi:hypothetical protein